VQSLSDHCVYTKHTDGITIIIIVWVDDIIICAPNLEIVESVKNYLSIQFKMKDMGQLSWFLGIEFTFTDNCIKMNQTKYLERVLNRFKMDDCNPKSVPCNLNVNKPNDVISKELDDPRLYREIVGSLIYVMSCTRPDICFVVNQLAQKMSKPNTSDFSLSKFALKYIKGTLNYCLTFVKSNNLDIKGYCDSDWGSATDRRSISGYCFKMNDESSLISWKSKKQPTVALSSCEAEYMAITYAIQEANFLTQLLADMTGMNKKSVDIFVDNQGAIMLAKNPVHHQRSKHIDIKYHYIRSQVKSEIINLHYIPSNENVADIFTKPVSKNKFKEFNVCY
jgi:hypothetical protein